MGRQNSKKRIDIKHIVILIVIIIFTVLAFRTASKYVLNEDSRHAINSYEFYLNSELLKESDADTVIYSDWNGMSDYSLVFDLKNYEDTLRTTPLDIKYKVLVDIKDENDNDVEYKVLIDNKELTKEDEVYVGVLKGEKFEDSKITLRIASQGVSTDLMKVDLNIETTSPYIKKLSRNFEIETANLAADYDVNVLDSDEFDYAKFLIKTYSFNGELKIIYDNTKVNPDWNSYLLKGQVERTDDDGNYYIEATIEQDANYQIDFIKKGSTLVTASDFTVR